MLKANVLLLTPEGEGRRFEARTAAGHTVTMDDKTGNAGPRPIELLLMGLGGCTGFDVINIVRKKRQVVTSYEIELEADQREEAPNVFTQVRIRHIFRGRGIDPKAVEDAIRLSETKYCSAGAMIAKTAQIFTTFLIEEESARAVA